MGSLKDHKQIHNFIGRQVEIEFRDGRIAFGTLSFFNWDQQVIHLSDYKLHRPSDEGTDCKDGEMIIINQKEWKTVEVRQ